ncbi:alpha/beta hydrolase-fold protein [Actinoplanes sp. NEAU-A12]|uniref:Alpha/beta hydrolase-fold protein n=1 Tax=Actinoplanes sandaracinus TaxID=3045177 RepID=A0ABT6WR03_9ACTN|nr:alpha/beta hydrolase-fold protein [Actinoplanes sandaracinus]MDI6102134.1 alpha/beta hydrolase-fold protein [Actinoplanes sandaracinus]
MASIDVSGGHVVGPRVSRLMSNPSPAAVEKLWSEAVAAGGPLIDPGDDTTSLVTFLWRGDTAATSVGLGVSLPMTRLPGTDLWHGARLLPTDLRTVYCLRHEGPERFPRHLDGDGPVHVDPINPRRVHFSRDPLDPDDHDCWGSLLELPGAPEEQWTSPAPGVAAGSLTSARVRSDVLGYELPVTLYRPAGVSAQGLPVVVFFDGHLARTMLRLPTVLDNLIAAGRIPPVAALLVHNVEARREPELRPLPTLARYVVDDLLAWVRATVGAGRPGQDVAGGMSLGGLAATYLGLARPDVFGGVVAHSGSFWWPVPDHGEPGRLIRDAARAPRSPVRFYLDVGVLEFHAMADGMPSQVEFCRAMRDALRANGHHVSYAEYSGAHDYVNWRRTVADGLQAVLAPS